MNIKSQLTKELLTELYITQKKSLREIGNEINKSITQVSRYLHRFGIQARPFTTKGIFGKKMSPESTEKKRIWMIQNNPFRGKKHTQESKDKQSLKMKGRKLTPEHRAKVIKNLIFGDVKGCNSHSWKGGISPINARLRNTKEYKAWNKTVKERDKWTCVLCGFYSKSNHADHIKPFSKFPELRFSVDNGRTLCANCHRKTETFGGRTKQELIQNQICHEI